MVFPGDDKLAQDLAESAGRRLLGLRATANRTSAQSGAGAAPDQADQLRRQGDLSSQEFLAAELGRLRPGDAVLSEEAADDQDRLSAERVWIIDPLDGTREFGEPGRTDWAVHVALWENGELTAGAVALPAQGKVLSTAQPPARPAGSPAGTRIKILASRTRPPAFLSLLAADVDAELLPLGSAGAKAAAVIGGQADAYIHGGGQYEWDSAAPVAVAQAAGLHCSRIDGSALRYNQPDPLVPDILICPVALAPMLLSAIDRALSGAAELGRLPHPDPSNAH